MEEVVAAEKIPNIKEAISKHGDLLLAPLKNELGEGFTYGEIRAVVNHLKHGELD